MRPTETMRPRSSRPIAVAVVVCCAVALGAVAVSGPAPVVLARTLAAAALICALAWAVYWRPEVEVSDGGVRIVNPWRTVHVPWPALEGVSHRWSLTVTTVDGRKVSAFAAPARGLAEQGAGTALSAARAVEDRREALRAAGFLDDVRLEGAPVTVEPATGPVLVCLGTLVATVASVLLPG